jgi:hypothetical protein
MGDGCGDDLDPRKGVRDDVVFPGDVRMSVVNCEMKSSWLNCRGEHLSLFCWMA